VNPEQLLFSKTHEWVAVSSDPSGVKIATVGITAFALEALTDLVFIELPALGRKLRAGEPFGVVESVKAVSDLNSPVDGEVVEANRAAAERPETLAQDPYGAGWLVKIRMADEAALAALMDYSGYRKQCEQETNEH
jgi:glycine cleavage system H protein